jgi:nucleotide-binding universal stress UspA family protein
MPDDDQRIQTDDEGFIVVGVDGSGHSRVALKWAADEAKRRGSWLRILHARSKGPECVPAWYSSESSELSPGEAIIDEAVALVATRHPSVVARGEVVDRPAAPVLTRASRSAELLVVGARGLGGFDELLLGSVSDQCVQYAGCPVAVVHSDSDDPPYHGVERRIVVGIDGSLGSTRALQWALEEASIRSASVEGVYAWQYPPVGTFIMGPTQGSRSVADEVVDAATDHAGRLAPDVPFRAVARFDGAVPALLDASDGAELLVVGSQGHGRFERALLGSVAHQCARHARCAVVVARPGGDGDSATRARDGQRSERSADGARTPVPPASAPVGPARRIA